MLSLNGNHSKIDLIEHWSPMAIQSLILIIMCGHLSYTYHTSIDLNRYQVLKLSRYSTVTGVSVFELLWLYSLYSLCTFLIVADQITSFRT